MDIKVFKLILDDEESDKNEDDNISVIPQKNNVEDLENKKVDKTIEDNDELNVFSFIEQLKKKIMKIKLAVMKKICSKIIS